MKKLIIKSSILLVAFSIFMTSCQKEEIADTEIAKIEVEQELEKEFSRLIYNNESYSKEEIDTNKQLAGLLEKPSYYLEDITAENTQTLLYVFDTQAEADKYFEIGGALESDFANGINVRVALELFRNKNQVDRIHRKVIYLNNFNFFNNQNLSRAAINQASSIAFRVTGLPQNRRANITFFDRARQQEFIGLFILSDLENGAFFLATDFGESENDKINSYRVHLSENSGGFPF